MLGICAECSSVIPIRDGTGRIAYYCKHNRTLAISTPVPDMWNLFTNVDEKDFNRTLAEAKEASGQHGYKTFGGNC